MSTSLTVETLADALGVCGACLVVVMYHASQQDAVLVSRFWYQTGNIVGSLFILLSLVHAPNAAAILIEVFWLGISVYGLRTHVGLGRHRVGGLSNSRTE